MLVLAGTLVALAILVPLGVRALSGGPAFTGLADGATVNPDGLTNVGVTVTGGDLADVQLLVDGAPAAARRDGDRCCSPNPGSQRARTRSPPACPNRCCPTGRSPGR